jgi:hypothetical protein
MGDQTIPQVLSEGPTYYFRHHSPQRTFCDVERCRLFFADGFNNMADGSWKLTY